MKQNIIKLIAALAVLAGMGGIAAADPCPGPEQWDNVNTPSLQYMYSIAATGSNPVTYSAGGIPFTNSIKEVCVASTSSEALSGTVIWSLWLQSDLTIKDQTPQWPRAWAQFKDGGNPYNIPADGAMHDVGTVTWDDAPGNTQKFLLHVVDTRCPTGDTCYVIPKGPVPPVPELSPMILTSAGLLGIVLVSRKYKSR